LYWDTYLESRMVVSDVASIDSILVLNIPAVHVNIEWGNGGHTWD